MSRINQIREAGRDAGVNVTFVEAGVAKTMPYCPLTSLVAAIGTIVVEDPDNCRLVDVAEADLESFEVVS